LKDLAWPARHGFAVVPWAVKAVAYRTAVPLHYLVYDRLQLLRVLTGIMGKPR
jgi:hypothetical protein